LRRLRLIAALQGALLLSGCLDPSRLNTSCEWVGDTTSAALDMAIAGDRRHLANDVRIAGENATRYRDSVKVRFGFAAAGSLDVECLDRLYTTIGAQHGVRRADLDAAAFMRDVPLDVALTYFPIGAAFLFVSLRMCRRFFRRVPPPGERWTVVVRVVWLGLVASAVATAVAHLYSWQVDTVRLRDFHINFRAAYLPIAQHPWLSFLAALTVFAVASLYEYRAALKRPAEQSRARSLEAWQH
jgi:outer membrane murein-binding lipoprotein Lpp